MLTMVKGRILISTPVGHRLDMLYACPRNVVFQPADALHAYTPRGRRPTWIAVAVATAEDFRSDVSSGMLR